MTTLERIKLKVRFVGDCWEWTGCYGKDGYGQMSVAGQYGAKRAHRVSYEVFIGPIPEGLELDHLCEHKGCVNPRHLEPVTRQENCQRGHDRLGRRYRDNPRI